MYHWLQSLPKWQFSPKGKKIHLRHKGRFFTLNTLCFVGDFPPCVYMLYFTLDQWDLCQRPTTSKGQVWEWALSNFSEFGGEFLPLPLTPRPWSPRQLHRKPPPWEKEEDVLEPPELELGIFFSFFLWMKQTYKWCLIRVGRSGIVRYFR